MVIDVVCLFQDNKINGVTRNTRLIGSSYLFPYVIPEPHVTSTTLLPDDQLLIIANQGLWRYISYQEAINEIIDIPDPVLAAKKLQDLAQGYRSQENIGILVVRLMVSHQERNRMRALLQKQFDFEQKILADLKLRDIEREELKKRLELEQMNEMVPMDIVKLKGAKKRKQITGMFINSDKDTSQNHYDETDEAQLIGVNGNKFPKQTSPKANWEQLLQKRLTEEVKDKELIHAMKIEEHDPYLPKPDYDNWSTQSKLKGQMKERIVTLPPKDDKEGLHNRPPPAPQFTRKKVAPEMVQLSTESLEFKRELKHPLNVDRDAILFHNMQLTRNKSRHLSTDSIDSTQSDPAYTSVKEISTGAPSSSHSIEVLIHGPPRKDKIGGSYKLPTQDTQAPDHPWKIDSCPTEMPMTERLQMLEEKGFLPEDKRENDAGKTVDDHDTIFDSDGHYDTIKNVNLENETSVKKVEETDEKVLGEHGDKTGHDCLEKDEDIDLYDTVGEIKAEHCELALSPELQVTADMQQSNDEETNKEWSSNSTSEPDVKSFQDPSELYATVMKVKKSVSALSWKENSKTQEQNSKLQGNGTFELTTGGEKQDVTPSINNKEPPPIPPRVPINPLPKADFNSNSLKSLEDLIAYNRLQQQKVSYKTNAKVAPPPPPKVPETTMISKTASQRSIVITYL